MATEVPLMIDPQTVEVRSTGGTAIHQILNAGEKRLAIKVKSSNNKNYMLKPVYCFVAPGASEPLIITRTYGPASTDRLVIEFLEAPGNDPDPQAFWKGKKACGEVTVPMNAT